MPCFSVDQALYFCFRASALRLCYRTGFYYARYRSASCFHGTFAPPSYCRLRQHHAIVKRRRRTDIVLEPFPLTLTALKTPPVFAPPYCARKFGLGYAEAQNTSAFACKLHKCKLDLQALVMGYWQSQCDKKPNPLVFRNRPTVLWSILLRQANATTISKKTHPIRGGQVIYDCSVCFSRFQRRTLLTPVGFTVPRKHVAVYTLYD